jgi:hypothetical protein
MKSAQNNQTQRQFLERRNHLWRALRELEPNNPKTEALIDELQSLIGWPRDRVLIGLGWQTTAEGRIQESEK